MTRAPTLEWVPTPGLAAQAGPSSPGFPRPRSAQPAVPGLVLADDRLTVLRPLYLGFTILATEPTPLGYTLGRALQNFPAGKATYVKHVGPRTRVTSLPLAARAAQNDFLRTRGVFLKLSQLRLRPAPFFSWPSNRQASPP